VFQVVGIDIAVIEETSGKPSQHFCCGMYSRAWSKLEVKKETPI